MLIATFRLLTASLQAMGSTDSGPPLCSCVVCSGWCVSIVLLFLSAVFSSGDRFFFKGCGGGGLVGFGRVSVGN